MPRGPHYSNPIELLFSPLFFPQCVSSLVPCSPCPLPATHHLVHPQSSPLRSHSSLRTHPFASTHSSPAQHCSPARTFTLNHSPSISASHSSPTQSHTPAFFLPSVSAQRDPPAAPSRPATWASILSAIIIRFDPLAHPSHPSPSPSRLQGPQGLCRRVTPGPLDPRLCPSAPFCAAPTKTKTRWARAQVQPI